MAHRSNVIQVLSPIESTGLHEKVIDPICKKELTKGESKHIIYQDQKTYYFCSKDCGKKFHTHKFVTNQEVH